MQSENDGIPEAGRHMPKTLLASSARREAFRAGGARHVRRSIIFAVTGLLMAASLTACPESPCDYVGTSAVVITPDRPCIDTRLTVCFRAQLTIRNTCAEPLYMSTEYGYFDQDADYAKGTHVEILPTGSIVYQVREDKALSKNEDRADYAVPARLGQEDITFSFAVTREE